MPEGEEQTGRPSERESGECSDARDDFSVMTNMENSKQLTGMILLWFQGNHNIV